MKQNVPGDTSCTYDIQLLKNARATRLTFIVLIVISMVGRIDLAAADIEYKLLKLKPQQGLIRISFSPNGKLLAASGGYPGRRKMPDPGLVKIWDISTGEVVFEQLGFPGTCISIRFSPDGKFFAVSCRDRKAYIFKQVINNHRQVQWQPWGKLAQPDVRIASASASYGAPLSFSPDGKKLAYANHSSRPLSISDPSIAIQLWEITEKVSLISTLTQFSFQVTDVCFLPDGRLLTMEHKAGNQGYRLCQWNKSSLTLEKELFFKPQTKQGVGSNISASKDGSLIAVDINGGAVILDGDSLEIKRKVLTAESTFSVSISPNGKYFATVENNGYKIWDTNTGSEIVHLDSFAIRDIKFSPDGITLASFGITDGGVKIWKLKDLIASDDKI